MTRLYVERRAELVRFFTARTGSASVAEDLVQDLYFKIENTDASEVRNGMAYLYRLGLNLMIDRLRSDVSARAREREFAASYSAGSHVDAPPSAEREAIAREDMKTVITAIENLPPQCRRVFRMHRFDGLSQGEIAQRLGISRRVVEKHVANALRHLAEAMK